MALDPYEQAEYASLSQDPDAQAQGGLSASEAAEMKSLQNELGPSWGDRAKQGLAVAGKALDYQRGAVGAPLVSTLASMISGKKTMSPEEYSGGLNPTTTQTAPRSADILARAGVPSGPKLSSVVPEAFQDPAQAAQKHWYDPTKYWPEKGGLLDVTPRGVAGGALDMATDPLTYESGGINKLVEMAKAGGQELSPSLKALSALFNPGSNAVEAVGAHNYAKGMAPLISKGEQYGKDVGDTLYKNGIWGTSGSIAKQGDAAAESLKNSRDALMSEATTAGASPSTARAFQPLVDHVQQLLSDGRLSPDEANKIVQNYADKMGRVPNPTLEQMSQWKSDISNSLPASVYDVTKNARLSQNMGKIVAGGNRDEVARAASEAIPGQGAKINEVNQDLGNLLTVQGVADKQAAREANRKLLTPQDLGHAGISEAAKPGSGILTLLARKAADIVNNPLVRTGAGYMGKKLGTGLVSAPVIDAATFEALKAMANKPTAGVGR